jgi:hypothetical protein
MIKRFTAELYEGHSDCAVLVPFDPVAIWNTTPRRIGYQKHMGHAVAGKVAASGTAKAEPFESWIWFYARQWRMVIDDDVLAKIKAEPGQRVKLAVRPHPKPETVAPYRPARQRG